MNPYRSKRNSLKGFTLGNNGLVIFQDFEQQFGEKFGSWGGQKATGIYTHPGRNPI